MLQEIQFFKRFDLKGLKSLQCILTRLHTLGSRIEVPVRLFFFGFFPSLCVLFGSMCLIVIQRNELPVCLHIWNMYAY